MAAQPFSPRRSANNTLRALAGRASQLNNLVLQFSTKPAEEEEEPEKPQQPPPEDSFFFADKGRQLLTEGELNAGLAELRRAVEEWYKEAEEKANAALEAKKEKEIEEEEHPSLLAAYLAHSSSKLGEEEEEEAEEKPWFAEEAERIVDFPALALLLVNCTMKDRQYKNAIVLIDDFLSNEYAIQQLSELDKNMLRLRKVAASELLDAKKEIGERDFETVENNLHELAPCGPVRAIARRGERHFRFLRNQASELARLKEELKQPAPLRGLRRIRALEV